MWQDTGAGGEFRLPPLDLDSWEGGIQKPGSYSEIVATLDDEPLTAQPSVLFSQDPEGSIPGLVLGSPFVLNERPPSSAVSSVVGKRTQRNATGEEGSDIETPRQGPSYKGKGREQEVSFTYGS